MTNTERCSCGARDKTKCSKENGLQSGKMCLKPLFDMPEDYVFKRMKCFILLSGSKNGRKKMNQTFEQRIQSIEDQLKEIRKESGESLARYSSSYPDEKRLINDREYCSQWIRGEIKASSDWFIKEIYK